MTLRGFAGPLEVVGGTLIIFGLFTRLAAFILCGQMAVVYFDQWAGRGFFPISNGGEEAVTFCFTWLWLVTAGSGRLSLDNLLGRESNLALALSGWEPWGRAIARVILALLFTLHGFRHVFGFLPKSASRAAVVPLALDKLPALVGWWEIAGGLLLLVGLFTSFSATITRIELAAAHLFESIPRGVWPLRNVGNETLIYLLLRAERTAARHRCERHSGGSDSLGKVYQLTANEFRRLSSRAARDRRRRAPNPHPALRRV